MNKITHLVSLSEFVDYIDEQEVEDEVALFYIKVYNNFLKLPLELGFFVPTDAEGNVLEEPDPMNTKYCTEDTERDCNEHAKDYNNWIESQQKVLFDGFEVKKDMHGQTKRTIVEKDKCRAYLKLQFYSGEVKEVYEHKTIERLITYKLPITEQVLKQIYG